MLRQPSNIDSSNKSTSIDASSSVRGQRGPVVVLVSMGSNVKMVKPRRKSFFLGIIFALSAAMVIQSMLKMMIQSMLKMNERYIIPVRSTTMPPSTRRGTGNVLDAYKTSESPGWAVFYNLYIRPEDDEDQDGPARAIRILEEQMNRVGGSYAANQNKTLSLFFNTVGRPNTLNASYTKNLCSVQNGFDCHFMDHYNEGFEEVTLKRLHEFCQKYPSEKVVYMHSKGSYHDAEHNRISRAHMADAILSESCLDPPNAECNTCSLLFFPMWAPMHPGNFWTADCEYVRKLLPPAQYRDRMSHVIRRVREMESRGAMRLGMYTRFLEDKLCEDRYAAECWVGSHPDIRPCDLSETELLIKWHNNELTKADFKFGMAPRHAWMEKWLLANHTEKMLMWKKRPKNRMKDFFLLPGNILKWFDLYNSTPPPDSWVWDWFPDGEKWKRGVEEFGPSVVDVYVNRTMRTRQKLT